MSSNTYRTLNVEKIISTQQRLQGRIAARFPDSGLSQVARELGVVANEAAERASLIRKPNVPLRIAVAALLLGALAVIVLVARFLQVRADLWEVMNLVQFVEAGLGGLVFLGLAVLFLVTLEMRIKRRRALAAIHELRAIAHVVDMHQLAKDPEGLVHRARILTEAGDQTTRTLPELSRYLNYCIELLGIISKIAAVYVQEFPDASTVAAVDQIETLTSGLSRKIAQKILVLEEIQDEAAPRRAAVLEG